MTQPLVMLVESAGQEFGEGPGGWFLLGAPHEVQSGVIWVCSHLKA